jgi:2-polyprenyl-3-methyl-5-hydroxy-6-metoxy-1,4-benzoquinol methylase
LNREQLIKTIAVLSGTLDKLQSLAANKISTKYRNNCRSAIHKKNKSYSFLPLSTRAAVAQIVKAYDVLRLTITADNPYPVYKFLDAGCGIGNIMLLATKTGFSAYGLEIDPTIIHFAKKVDICPNNIIKQNILTYKNYSEYDVIYFYRPITNGAKQVKFENCVRNQMKKGAILIPNFMSDRNIETDTKFKKIIVERMSYIYQKVTT